MDREIVVLADLDQASRETAERLVKIARDAIAGRGRFTLALSGGSTPATLFSLLASEAYRDRIEWGKTIVMWSDERCVPPDHPDSNYGMARDLLLSKVSVPAGNVHRIRGEISPAQAALEYEHAVRREIRTPAETGIPVFDLILLGMGPDGHTASLFPGTLAIHEQTRLVVSHLVPKLAARRITFTPPLINAAAHVVFLVAGQDKADALRAVLQDDFRPDTLPAQIVRPLSGQLTWLVDRAAAAKRRQE
jgi:6-phosphogluconolactonase